MIFGEVAFSSSSSLDWRSWSRRCNFSGCEAVLRGSIGRVDKDEVKFERKLVAMQY